MAKSKMEKIAGIEEEIKRLENMRRRLVQAQKEQERKDRTKRLCRRMGLFESLLPGTIQLTEEQFKTFLEKTAAAEHGRRLLDEMTAQNAAAPTAKITHTTQESRRDGDADGGYGARERD